MSLTLITGPAGDDKVDRIVAAAKAAQAAGRTITVFDFKCAEQWCSISSDVVFMTSPSPAEMGVLLESSSPGDAVFIDGLQFAGQDGKLHDRALVILFTGMQAWAAEKGFDITATWTGTVPHTLREAADAIQ